MDNHTLGLIGKIVAVGFWACFALLFLCLSPIMCWIDKRKERKVCPICAGDQYACTCDEQSYVMPECEVIDEWISVDERLPKDDEVVGDWFWVKRQGGIELMYGSWQKWKDPHEFKWQDPYTVGDHEGLHIEYYDDVTHWRSLIPPEEEK